MLALLLLVSGWRRLLLTITAFTLGHTLTPTAATLGWVTAPVALVAGTFGLLHGLGFAAALRALGLPEHPIPLAFASFNVGVELGQVLFITAVFSLLQPSVCCSFQGRDTEMHNRLWRGWPYPGAYLTGTVGMFWLFERMQGFWA